MTASRLATVFLIGLALVCQSTIQAIGDEPDSSLKVVIIRHGEKPDSGDNLSCMGFNRALQLPGVIYKKHIVPEYTYVPSVGIGSSTRHARMFQTVIPLTVKYNLTVNSKFAVKDYKKVSADVLLKKGTVLIVWEHKAIPKLARHLGVEDPPSWKSKDFDGIWIITYQEGKALLVQDRQGITQSKDCPF